MNGNEGTTFADRLVQSLEPLRNAFLAQALFVLFESGVYDQLINDPQDIQELSRILQMRADRLGALLDYALNEGLVKQTARGYSATPLLIEYGAHQAWYQLFIGGYGQTLLDAPTLLDKNCTDYGVRNINHVGRGSTGISMHDTIPLSKLLLPQAGELRSVVDLGSSDAAYLVELCSTNTSLRGLAIEPNSENAAHAQHVINAQGLGERITVLNTSFQAYVERPVESPDCYILAFVLQEIIAQEGIDYVATALTRLQRPEKPVHLLVIEVNAAVPQQVLDHGLGRAYYNPYLLMHQLTRQTLLTKSSWLALFDRCGYDLVAEESPSADVDPTGLELGFLLRGRGLGRRE